MREASEGNGMGGELHCRSHQWDIPAIDILPAVPALSPLLPAQHGSLQGQISGRPRERREAGLAPDPHHAHQRALPGGVVGMPRSL